MKSPLSVLSSWPRLIVQVLQQQGVNTDTLLKNLAISEQTLADPNAQISTLQVIRLWQAGAEIVGDQLPLLVARSVNAGTFHALGFAMATSATGFAALKRLQQYYPILTSSVQLEVVEQDDWVLLRLESSPLIHALAEQFDLQSFSLSLAQLRESAALALLSLCRSFFGVNFQLERLYLNRFLGERYADYAAQVGCPIIENADFVQLCLAKNMLLKPLPSANAALAELHEQIVQSYLKQLKGNISTMVAGELIKALPKGEASQDAIARRLSMSTRSLQRKLNSEGSHFREILSYTRHELALQYLQRSEIPVLEIGYRLGFSEPANFTRAFKRWQGVPPQQYREQTNAIAKPTATTALP